MSIRAGRKLAATAALALLAAGCAITDGTAPPARDLAIEGERVFPESITSDSAGTLYHSSNGGTIYRALPGASESTPWILPDERNGIQSLFGILAEEERGLLWTCSNPNGFTDPPQQGRAKVLLFDLATGALNGTYLLPDGPVLCNDIAVGPDGAVWATDTIGGRIVRFGLNANEFAVFAADDALRGVDGIAFGGDGTLYVNNVQANLLQRVERGSDGSFAGLTTLATSQPMVGPDALRPLGGNRFLQSESTGGKVTLVEIAGDNAQITVLREGLEFPAAVTAVGSTAYAAEGKIGYLFNPARRNEDPGSFTIYAIPIPEAR